MAKVKLEVTHPSWDEHKFGEIIEVDSKKVTDRMKQFTKPYEGKVMIKSDDKQINALNSKIEDLEKSNGELTTEKGELEESNGELTTEIEKLKAEIEELKKAK